MDRISNYSTLAIAIMTVIYTIGTILLWIETTKSSKLAIKEFEIAKKLTEANLLSHIFDSYKDIFKLFLLDKDILLLLEDEEDISKFKKDTLASLLINNASRIFYYYNKGIVDKEIWHSAVEDTKDLFSWKFIREHWNNYKQFSYSDFVTFIDSEIIEKIEKEDRNDN